LVSERNDAVTAAREIHTQKVILEQKIKELENQKKALIEELGGAVGREDLEYATWDLVLQTTKLLVKERDETAKENQSLKQQNKQLEQSAKVLESEISTLRAKNNSLSYSQNQLSQIESRIQHLEKEKQDKDSCIRHLEKEKQEKDFHIRNLERDCKQQLQNLNKIEKLLQEKEANIKTVVEQKNELENKVKLLNDKIKLNLSNSLKLKNSVTVKNGLEGCTEIIQLKTEIQRLTIEKEELARKSTEIIELKTEIQNLIKQKEELAQKLALIKSSIYSNNSSTEQFIQTNSNLDILDIVDMYNELIHYIQTNFFILGIQEIDRWIMTEPFYFHIISQLYIINYSLIYSYGELLNSNYLDKELYWCNKGLLAELDVILCIDKFRTL
jgi:DNA repair exonuclease SbcCD ATPase subunit